MSKRSEMTLTCERILMSLNGTQAKYEKLYCYPSVEVIQKNLRLNYGCHRSTRQIFRSLKWLQDNNYIDRKQRVKDLKNGQWRQQSTLYMLLGKAHYYLGAVARWVKDRFRGFRMTQASHHKNPTGYVIRTDYPKFHKEDSKDPPFWATRVGIRGFESFKALCQAL